MKWINIRCHYVGNRSMKYSNCQGNDAELWTMNECKIHVINMNVPIMLQYVDRWINVSFKSNKNKKISYALNSWLDLKRNNCVLKF